VAQEAVGLAVPVGQAVLLGQAVPEEAGVQSHAAWAAVWAPTESPGQSLLRGALPRVAAQRAEAAPAPWASRGEALFF